MDAKQTIRLEILAELKSLTEQQRQLYNEEVLTLLKESEQWEKAKSIAVTLSRFPEVNTEKIIEAAFSAGKKIVIPYSGKRRQLSFYPYERGTELEVSTFGLAEPRNRTIEVLKKDIDLIIVPGLAYSPEGYRVGFGGGYYDRYLADYRGMTLSVLYPFQLRAEVSNMIESFDIPIQQLFISGK